MRLIRQRSARQEAPATSAVIAHVRRLILRGQLRPGDQLPAERDLAVQVGVSRASVRAGLAALAAKGVLTARHGAGTFVSDGPPVLDSEPLSLLAALHGFTRAEMFEARRILEAGVAGLAAKHATAGHLAAMADEVAEMFASLKAPQTFLVHDIRFHRAVAAACGNPILASLVEMVSAIFYEHRRRTATRDADLTTPATAHRQIYRAIRLHDSVSAERLMSEHLISAERAQESENRRSRRASAASAASAKPKKGSPKRHSTRKHQ